VHAQATLKTTGSACAMLAMVEKHARTGRADCLCGLWRCFRWWGWLRASCCLALCTSCTASAGVNPSSHQSSSTQCCRPQSVNERRIFEREAIVMERVASMYHNTLRKCSVPHFMLWQSEDERVSAQLTRTSSRPPAHDTSSVWARFDRYGAVGPPVDHTPTHPPHTHQLDLPHIVASVVNLSALRTVRQFGLSWGSEGVLWASLFTSLNRHSPLEKLSPSPCPSTRLCRK
jgi:hypothetical protein